MSYLPLIGLASAALVGLAVAAWARPHITRSFEFKQRYFLILAIFILLLAALYFYLAFTQGQAYWPAGLWLFAAGCLFWEALRPKRDRDSRADYVHDLPHCGQCGYDLRGTVGPTCPECGWKIPPDVSHIERRDWALWWRTGWRISYLENWRKTLTFIVINLLIFIALTAWAAWVMVLPIALIAGVMALLFAINAVRVVQYGRRERLDINA